MKIEKKTIIFEICLIFTIFIIPSYFAQSGDVDPSLFSSLQFNLAYILTSIPQILIILYFIYLRKGKQHRQPGLKVLLEPYGFAPAGISLLWKTLLVFIGTLVIAMTATLLLAVPAIAGAERFQPVQWQVPNYTLFPLVFCTCLATGYREEVLFRSYLMTELENLGLGPLPRITGTALLFSAGHLYQGLLAFITTFFIGLFLGFMFHRYKNVHMLAIGHGLYNFFSLIIIPVFSSFIYINL